MRFQFHCVPLVVLTISQFGERALRYCYTQHWGHNGVLTIGLQQALSSPAAMLFTFQFLAIIFFNALFPPEVSAFAEILLILGLQVTYCLLI